MKNKYRYIKSCEKKTSNILYIVSCREIVNININRDRSGCER